jgi:hypothetical protein
LTDHFKIISMLTTRFERSHRKHAEFNERRRLGTPALILATAFATVWGEVLLDPTVRALVLLGVAVGSALGLMAAAMALGLVGFGLFALFDRASSWVARAARWPDE